ncbi:hypothetical protein B9T31_14940 [Acinetobacter sp. ANC 4558]|uniref:hypothetical protein n=1 Tax=Acinetobacter sp. ANC 4558 TaxID=1977876 RepID=UPI000A339881|nr:hypothetical protein [Acinetobacter sp. ANC 4558]OTG81818.1 hypothetical protein B9T31_14940 [Acinetobacter sp. ANC 4558]
MKVGHIGGISDGQFIDLLYDRSRPLVMEWTHYVRNNDQISIVSTGLQRIITENSPKFDLYKLILLKHNNEMKYFYIFKDFSMDQIREVLANYWDLSDVVGYDLD